MSTDTLPIPAEKLTRAAKARASKAIESVHLAYYEKGGLRDLEEKIDSQRGAAAKHIFALALWASENAETHGEMMALFLGMCAYAEAQYKADHEISNLKDPVAGLPTWAVFKSNLLRGMREHKLDPVEYRSEGAFRVAMQKLENKAQASLPPPEVSKSPRARKEIRELEDTLGDSVRHDTLRTLISQIIFECEHLKPGRKEEAAAVLRETMNRLQMFVDPRKVA